MQKNYSRKPEGKESLLDGKSQKRLDESVVVCHESYESDGKQGHCRRNNLRENMEQENVVGDGVRDSIKLYMTTV